MSTTPRHGRIRQRLGAVRRGTTVVAGVLALVVGLPHTAFAHHRLGTEPGSPYAMPATAPMRGCQSVAPTPTNPSGLGTRSR